jgi:hypothetical protein
MLRNHVPLWTSVNIEPDDRIVPNLFTSSRSLIMSIRCPSDIRPSCAAWPYVVVTVDYNVESVLNSEFSFRKI